ncbi:MAG TPA: hypothetical protein VF043_36530 [Ktedonobacteraceae bacterium]
MAPAEIAIPLTLTSGEQKQAAITPQQLYRQSMEDIWEKVHQLPRGQDQVVASQLWELGKSSSIPTPIKFPALAAHGFIVEQLVENQIVWKPYLPDLKDFWRIGIDVSQAYGFRLQPQQAFEANLQSLI